MKMQDFTKDTIFAMGHPGTLPMRHLAGVIILPFRSNPSMDFLYIHRSKTEEFRFNPCITVNETDHQRKSIR
ncbi:MAG: hypothetical protein R6V49_03325 [Bacteroidales bacterium]